MLAGSSRQDRVVHDLLTRRALNRATLDRQLLLHRSDRPPLEVVEHLVGLQAQLPQNPHLGLWSRIERYGPAALDRLLLDRSVVRVVVMRGTIHLVTADDCLRLRPLMQPVLDHELHVAAGHGPALANVDLDAALAFARELLAEQPRTGTELRAAMAERFPEHDPAALAYAVRNLLAVVQVPPRGLWCRSGQVRSTTVETWLGRPLVPASPDDRALDDMVLRYLAAFGPATVADVQTWSRLTGLREVVERLRPGLRTYRDERGRELFDLPDTVLPDPDGPAPTRFLPEYDNVLLSHDDRTRVIAEEHRKQLSLGTQAVRGTVLHDGFVAATWRLDAGALVVRHVGRLSKRAASSIAAEGRRLVRFLAGAGGDPEGEVRFEPV